MSEAILDRVYKVWVSYPQILDALSSNLYGIIWIPRHAKSSLADTADMATHIAFLYCSLL